MIAHSPLITLKIELLLFSANSDSQPQADHIFIFFIQKRILIFKSLLYYLPDALLKLLKNFL